ncbi:MAG: B12-binding domain-containing radical SAM protein, partial [Proteobacteria bacterium]|nr:B12-binding domain-containing radical SAM protein [Pseudomonadota bacterium]
STAHTLLWYRHHGPDVFRRLAERAELAELRIPGGRRATARATFDVAAVAAAAAEHEAELWERMIYLDRRVSRAVYEERAAALPAAVPRPGLWGYAAGELPRRVRAGRRGRR